MGTTRVPLGAPVAQVNTITMIHTQTIEKTGMISKEQTCPELSKWVTCPNKKDKGDEGGTGDEGKVLVDRSTRSSVSNQ